MESHGEEHSNQHWPEFPQGYRPCALIQFSAAIGKWVCEYPQNNYIGSVIV